MNELIKQDGIAGKIYQIRGVQVMLDRDLAELYETETRTLKQAVKRNADRFPPDFMFELGDEDVDLLVSQSVIPSRKHLGGAVPYAFTEQGVSMLSSILRTPLAVDISIKIMRAFVEMRRFIQNNAELFSRIGSLELRQLRTEKKVDQVLDAIGTQELEPKQGVFFNGQIFDAYSFVSKLVRRAKESIVLIDNYVDDSVLTMLSKRRKGVAAKIYCKRFTKQLQLDLEKHNAQYEPVELVPFDDAHDRFMILDGTRVYHIGASLKDLGKKWFAFSEIEKDALSIIERLPE
ncbi:ORF6N domain-containing protein [Tichowtungia aerotolerans]|uniref:ORF6N domain-containing protein n=1 Tax=Tichowtungia aerotolerans TaxID=2697043 RepID=A0A6P1M6Z9_9BACT|nr:ORF6N domain-containing protein [Tichowtungia aerotolerans]QHI68793.1 ORF6N domain-containing protein [Tichowtungia aerotolerans]